MEQIKKVCTISTFPVVIDKVIGERAKMLAAMGETKASYTPVFNTVINAGIEAIGAKTDKPKDIIEALIWTELKKTVKQSTLFEAKAIEAKVIYEKAPAPIKAEAPKAVKPIPPKSAATKK